MITISILPNGAVSIYHDGKPVVLPTKEDFRAPPKNVAVSGDDIPGRLANEFAALPAGSMLKTAIVDYGRERDQLRAVHGLPRPAACP